MVLMHLVGLGHSAVVPLVGPAECRAADLKAKHIYISLLFALPFVNTL